MTLRNANTHSVRRLRPHRQLQQLRINEGLSPNALAYRAGVSGNTIRMVEAGFRPGPRIQFAIAGVFGLRPLDLWPIEEQSWTR
jgi:DNA-binding XRE family transcriptional regulator